MKTRLALLLGAMAAALAGCSVVPTTEYNALQAENRNLNDQNRAQAAEIDNLKNHAGDLEERVIHNEKQLAKVEEQSSLERSELNVFQRERDGLYAQVRGMPFGRRGLSPEVSRRLAELSRQYPSLQFDAGSGVGRVDADIVFDGGEATLTPDAQRTLDDLARALKSPTGRELKIVVVGHGDGSPADDPSARQRYPNDFHLSAARAVAVADHMRRDGLSEQRLGVAGYGFCPPAGTNAYATDRTGSRRVEIFVIAPDVPVVGWTETTPNVHGAGVRR